MKPKTIERNNIILNNLKESYVDLFTYWSSLEIRHAYDGIVRNSITYEEFLCIDTSKLNHGYRIDVYTSWKSRSIFKSEDSRSFILCDGKWYRECDTCRDLDDFERHTVQIKRDKQIDKLLENEY